MTYTIQQAKANLLRLIKEVEQGNEVVITRGKTPVAKLVPIAATTKQPLPGKLKGQLSWKPGAFDPLTPEELKDWGIE